jgi:hypothetical protein
MVKSAKAPRTFITNNDSTGIMNSLLGKIFE